jgi:hypothetical protein
VARKKSKSPILTAGEILSKALLREKFPDRKRGWTVEHHGKNVHVVKIAKPSASKMEQWILLLADNHVDNPSARNDVLARLLEEAVERDAVICCIGDQLDLMCGVGDKRGNKAMLRSSLMSDAYFDKVIEQAADIYAKSGTHIAMMAEGNHENGWRRHHEVCPTEHLVRAIKERSNSLVSAGGYGGWIKFQFNCGNTHLTYTVRYQHGTGSGASPATMGLLDLRRMYSWIEGADTIVISHNHASNIAGIAREYLSSQNGQYRVEKRYCDFIRVGTTKDAWKTGAGGWEIEKGFGPSPVRQKWIRLFIKWECTDQKRGRPTLAWEVHDAQ